MTWKCTLTPAADWVDSKVKRRGKGNVELEWGIFPHDHHSQRPFPYGANKDWIQRLIVLLTVARTDIDQSELQICQRYRGKGNNYRVTSSWISLALLNICIWRKWKANRSKKWMNIKEENAAFNMLDRSRVKSISNFFFWRENFFILISSSPNPNHTRTHR